MPNDSQTDVCQTGELFSLAIVSYENMELSVRSAVMQGVTVIVEQQAWKSVSFTLLKCCSIHITSSKCKHYYQQMPLCDNIFVDGCCVSLHLVPFSTLVCCLQTRRALHEAGY
jgi:hypothetical protein